MPVPPAERWQDSIQLFNQTGEVVLKGRPDNIIFNLIVTVYQPLPHTNDFFPFNLWIFSAGFFCNASRRFTNNLQSIRKCISKKQIFF